MTRREFAGLGADPAPGDPAALAAAAHQAHAAAADLTAAATRLTPVIWTGEAADAFRTTLGPLPADLRRAAGAHRVAGRTLHDYADGLHARQLRADRLETEAATLRAREAAAIAEVNRLAGMVAPTASAEFATLSAQYAAAHSRASSAGADLVEVLAAAKVLAEDHRTAAAAAARTLRSAADTAPYDKPGLLSRALDRTKRWITDHADVLTNISAVLKGVSTVLGTVSLVPGLQFLAPFAIAAGALALTLDVAIKLATGKGSWRALALDGALTVLPTGPVARGLNKITDVNLGLAAANRRIPPAVKGRVFRAVGNLPEGVTRAQADEARQLIRAQAGHYGDDVIVQGCRAEYRAEGICDIDIGLRVSPEEFTRIHRERFVGKVPTRPEKDAMVNSAKNGIVHTNRAGMKSLWEDLEEALGMDVDISVIRRGGAFDQEPWIRL